MPQNNGGSPCEWKKMVQHIQPTGRLSIKPVPIPTTARILRQHFCQSCPPLLPLVTEWSYKTWVEISLLLELNVEVIFRHGNAPSISWRLLADLEAFLYGRILQHTSASWEYQVLPSTRDVKSHAMGTQATFLILLGKILGNLISVNG